MNSLSSPNSRMLTFDAKSVIFTFKGGGVADIAVSPAYHSREAFLPLTEEGPAEKREPGSLTRL